MENFPKTIELTGEVFPEMVTEHAHSSAFAMQMRRTFRTKMRTLIYLGIALATGSKSLC